MEDLADLVYVLTDLIPQKENNSCRYQKYSTYTNKKHSEQQVILNISGPSLVQPTIYMRLSKFYFREAHIKGSAVVSQARPQRKTEKSGLARETRSAVPDQLQP